MVGKNISFIIIVTAVVMASCDFPFDFFMGLSGNSPDEPANDKFFKPEITCNATQYLLVNSEQYRDKVNEFGTELNEYRLQIKNIHQREVVIFMGYEHRADIWQGLDNTEWTLLNTMEPKEIDTRDVYKTIYHEKDAEGPTLYLIEKYAGILGTTECITYLEDEEYLSKIAIPINY